MEMITSGYTAKQILTIGMIICLNDIDLRIKGITEDSVFAVPVQWDDERVFDDDYIEVGTPDRYEYTDFIGAYYITTL